MASWDITIGCRWLRLRDGRGKVTVHRPYDKGVFIPLRQSNAVVKGKRLMKFTTDSKYGDIVKFESEAEVKALFDDRPELLEG